MCFCQCSNLLAGSDAAHSAHIGTDILADMASHQHFALTQVNGTFASSNRHTDFACNFGHSIYIVRRNRVFQNHRTVRLNCTTKSDRLRQCHAAMNFQNEIEIRADRIEDFNQNFLRSVYFRGSVIMSAISAIDIALWDIRSKVTKLPLYQLLGGYRESIPFYIAGGYYGPDKGIPELQKEMEQYVSWGAKAVKMKVGALSIKEDAARVKAVREVIGEDVKLLLDANCAYRPYEAIEFSRQVEEYCPFWFEEPVDADDYEGYKKVAAKSAIPIAGGENESTRYGFRDLINTQAVSILNPDATCTGGVTEFLKIASLASANGVAMSPHGQQQVHIHLDCAVPGSILAEFYPPQYDAKVYEAFKNPIIMNADGTISPGKEPGTGLDINEEVLKD